MERLRRVANLWSWLPAFRAVAETQHLPTASRQLGISASALSRTIRLLEDDLGRPLFRRGARRIELDDGGRTFLAAVRTAMRIIHDATIELEGGTLEGPVSIAITCDLPGRLLGSTLARLRATHPELVPCLRRERPDAVVGLLLRGQVDLALVLHPGPDANIFDASVERHLLGGVSRGVYCGPSHALHGRTAITLEEICEHGFVAAPADRAGDVADGWPLGVERRVEACATDPALVLEICRVDGLLAVLPDPIEPRAGAEGLWRLPSDAVEPAEAYALTRVALRPGDRAEVVAAAFRASLAIATRRDVDPVPHGAGTTRSRRAK